MNIRLKRSFKLLTAPLEPILHLSRERLLGIGLSLFFGHILFGILWTYAIPQHYENPVARVLATLSAIPFLFLNPTQLRDNAFWRWYCVAVIVVTAPLFFVWMFIMNPHSAMWMATVSVSLVAIYHLLDWRIATAALALIAALSAPLEWVLQINESILDFRTTEDRIAIGFAWFIGFVTGVSSANEHIHRLKSTLRAMGVVAHELRTPLASISLLADALRDGGDPLRSSDQITAVVRRLNHQIDSQIINAQMVNLHPGSDGIGARAVVQNAIDTYPLKKDSDRANILLDVSNDFLFYGNTRLFTQTLQNLIKNALHAMMKGGKAFGRGSIRFEVTHDDLWGYIRIKDCGPGIPASIRRSIFEPFYSTQKNYSSGLGLSFCKQVVEINNGYIWVENSSPEGSTFTIKLKLCKTRAPAI